MSPKADFQAGPPTVQFKEHSLPECSALRAVGTKSALYQLSYTCAMDEIVAHFRPVI